MPHRDSLRTPDQDAPAPIIRVHEPMELPAGVDWLIGGREYLSFCWTAEEWTALPAEMRDRLKDQAKYHARNGCVTLLRAVDPDDPEAVYRV